MAAVLAAGSSSSCMHCKHFPWSRLACCRRLRSASASSRSSRPAACYRRPPRQPRQRQRRLWLRRLHQWQQRTWRHAPCLRQRLSRPLHQSRRSGWGQSQGQMGVMQLQRSGSVQAAAQHAPADHKRRGLDGRRRGSSSHRSGSKRRRRRQSKKQQQAARKGLPLRRLLLAGTAAKLLSRSAARQSVSAVASSRLDGPPRRRAAAAAAAARHRRRRRLSASRLLMWQVQGLLS